MNSENSTERAELHMRDSKPSSGRTDVYESGDGKAPRLVRPFGHSEVVMSERPN